MLSRSLLTFSSRLSRSLSRPFHSRDPVLLRAQTIQLVSLLGDDTKGTLYETLVKPGETVVAGQAVARIRASTDKEMDVYAPRPGKIVEWHVTINDSVSIGDNIVTVDVEEDKLSDLQQAWVDHLRQHKGNVQSSFYDENVQTCENVPDLQGLAHLMESTPQNMKALQVYERILELQSESPSDLAQTQTSIGTLFYRLGDLESAKTHLEHALQLSEKTSPKDAIAVAHIHLAAVMNQQGDLEGCFQQFESALKLQQDHFGNDHPIVAATLNNMGAILYSSGDWDGATSWYEKGLEIYRRIRGEDHLDTAGSYNNLGLAYKHKGNHGKALEMIQKALQIRKALHKSVHPDVAASHYSLGQVLSTVNELKASLEQYQAALAIQQEIYGRHILTARTINNIGAVLYQQQKYQAALDEYEKGLDILKELYEKSNKTNNDTNLVQDVISSYNHVGLTRLQPQQFNTALESLELARTMQMDLFGKDYHGLAVTIGAIGNVYKARGDYDQALMEFQSAHTLLEKSFGSNHPDVASSHNNIGLMYATQNNFDKALEHYKLATETFLTSLGENHPYVGSCHFNMALLKQHQQDIPGAMRDYLDARDIWRSSLGPDHPQTVLALKAIEDLQTMPMPKS